LIEGGTAAFLSVPSLPGTISSQIFRVARYPQSPLLVAEAMTRAINSAFSTHPDESTRSPRSISLSSRTPLLRKSSSVQLVEEFAGVVLLFGALLSVEGGVVGLAVVPNTRDLFRGLARLVFSGLGRGRPACTNKV